ncbi:MAG: hypothetical protein FJX74_07595 [Armatimonadetes bacterium]|nr:hypothetical protein [Armatimonadota bacterium]
MRLTLGVLALLAVVVAATICLTGCPTEPKAPEGTDAVSPETEPSTVVAPEGEKAEEGAEAATDEKAEEATEAAGEKTDEAAPAAEGDESTEKAEEGAAEEKTEEPAEEKGTE